MICPNCGTENINDSKFCVKCGKELETTTSESPIQNMPNNNIDSSLNSNTVNNTEPSLNNAVTNNTETITNNTNMASVQNNTNTQKNSKISFKNYITIIKSLFTKPFTGLKEEINKINDILSSGILALILAGIATLLTLIKTIITTVRVTSLWGGETSWVWDNVSNINFVKAIGLNFLLYLGIIFAIGGLYYLASLVVKKQTTFPRTLSVAVAAIIPMYICYTLISPILSILWAPLGLVATIIGIVYSLILIYELMSEELSLLGNAKFYLNLICLGITTIIIYYIIMYLMLADVATGLSSIFNL